MTTGRINQVTFFYGLFTVSKSIIPPLFSLFLNKKEKKEKQYSQKPSQKTFS